MFEAWGSKNLRIDVRTNVQTIQLDDCEDVEIVVPNLRHFEAIVHINAVRTKVTVGNLETFELPPDEVGGSQPHNQYVLRMIDGKLVNEVLKRSNIFPVYGGKATLPAAAK
ncbi:hypothetical protein BC936DRAFT_138569 [Jimgerdemannia flammicorona]|uniref:Uncharacterized protein n=1 Tax=Jimgerdemannia flammicorona TaxID=994334 RepID=A0A433DIB9_9FUNG|nr:hypothetical protein BC936DRAFT_138569 [Jimgerdemannia flammicorona]